MQHISLSAISCQSVTFCSVGHILSGNTSHQGVGWKKRMQITLEKGKGHFKFQQISDSLQLRKNCTKYLGSSPSLMHHSTIPGTLKNIAMQKQKFLSKQNTQAFSTGLALSPQFIPFFATQTELFCCCMLGCKFNKLECSRFQTTMHIQLCSRDLSLTQWQQWRH